MAPTQISELPYDQRRLIVVRDAEAEAADPPTSAGRRLGRAFMSGGVLGVGVAMAAVEAASMARAILMARRSIEGLLAITMSEAEAAALRFPVGHPRRKVVYVGHPIAPLTYIPMAHFHAFLFEHKVAEALRLIRSLGADSVDVIHVEGWDQRIGIALTAPLPGAEPVQVGTTAGLERGQGKYVMAKMRLKPAGTPRVPANLIWLPHEPLWQEIVDARLVSGLTSFVLDVRSHEDFGVNTSLKALVAKSGLEAGGSFIEHRATLWRIEGTFAA
jgi:hypothetical protein